VFLRVVAVVCTIFAILAASGWAFNQSVAHAVGWLAAGFLAFLLSTIPYGPVA
jgi:peptidoglycan biosynthesis protein MviN/MurJ (putative lipid II flippase)